MKLRRLLKSPWVAYKRWRRPWWLHQRVETDSEGFRIISTLDPDAPREEYEWSDVVRVEAYKRDAHLVELICLTLFTANDECELNNRMGGWKEFVRAFEKALPDQFPEAEWFPDESGSMTGRYPTI